MCYWKTCVRSRKVFLAAKEKVSQVSQVHIQGERLKDKHSLYKRWWWQEAES